MKIDDSTKSTKNIAMRKVAWRTFVIVSTVFFSMFFFSNDATLADLSNLIRLGLACFFTLLTAGLGWLYLKNKNFS